MTGNLLSVIFSPAGKCSQPALWSKCVKVYTLCIGATLQNLKICNLLSCGAPFDLRYFSLHKQLPNCPLTVSKVSVACLREVSIL